MAHFVTVEEPQVDGVGGTCRGAVGGVEIRTEELQLGSGRRSHRP